MCRWSRKWKRWLSQFYSKILQHWVTSGFLFSTWVLHSWCTWYYREARRKRKLWDNVYFLFIHARMRPLFSIKPAVSCLNKSETTFSSRVSLGKVIMKALLKSEHFAYTSQNLSLHAFFKKSVAFLVQDLVVVVTNCPFSSFFIFFSFLTF